jgi:parvulin-like peptidyl-prolyl isomerase
MFGTIRKHQKWLWLAIIVPTIITFVWYFGPSSKMNGPGGRESANYGSINGERITQAQLGDAQREAMLHHFFQSGRWPDESVKEQLQRDTYSWLLLIQKQEQLGIHVSTEQAAQAAAGLVRQMAPVLRQIYPNAQNGQISARVFAEQLLPPPLSSNDLERYCQHWVGLQQMISTIGVSGKLLTPDEAKGIYEREYQELATEAVFFSGSNHLDSVTVSPEAIAQFYTNNVATSYRIMDRVQVHYVKFDVSNYMAQAEAALNTNLTALVETNLSRMGTNFGRFGKTIDEARTNIQDRIIRGRALNDAIQKARTFANELLDMQPISPDNLEKLAKTNGLTVGTTAPFEERADPPKELGFTEEFEADGQKFVRAAFSLNPADRPFEGPFVSELGVYEIGYFKKIPGGNPPLEQVRDKVTADLKLKQAMDLAHQEAEAFYLNLTNGLAHGGTFSNLCVEAKLKPVSLTNFSRSTRDLPAVEEHMPLGQLQQIAFDTKPGNASRPISTKEGGAIIYVKAKLPIETAKMEKELPLFTNYLRQKQSEEAFNVWFSREFQKVAREIPALEPQQPPMSRPAKS